MAPKVKKAAAEKAAPRAAESKEEPAAAKGEDVPMAEKPAPAGPAAAEAATDVKPDAAKDGEKKEEKAEPPAPEPEKQPEKPAELEEDAAPDKRAKVKSAGIDEAASTPNAFATANGKLLMTLSDGGFQYLLAGVRTDVGLKAGRYMFETKIVEMLKPPDANGNIRQLCRIGLSLGSSSTLLTDSPGCVHFDCEGFYFDGKAKQRVSQKLSRDQTIALVVNLQAGHPNANTVSLFRGGARISEPQPLPQDWAGRALYPTITFRRVTLQVNFGPVAQAKLPFACRMLSDAAAADVEVTKAPSPAGGKYHVVYPVGLPEQGYFDWVDDFLEKNPGYTEISDRKVLEWIAKSGVAHEAGKVAASNDKPSMQFGVPALDDMSVRRILGAIAPTLRRNYIIPELRSNLLAAERAKSLQRFGSSEFTKSAVVIMGEPTQEYKGMVQARTLAEKQQKKARELEQKRVKEENRKKALEARAKLMAQRGQKVEEPAEKEEESKAMEDEEVVELTEEEKACWYRKSKVPDLTAQTLSKCFTQFSLPTREEGFDDVAFKWQGQDACAKILTDLILEKKRTQRVDDLQPGAEFKEQAQKWQKALQDWKREQSEWKHPMRRKELLARKQKAKAAAKGEEAAEGEEKEAAAPMEIDMDELDVFSVEDVTDVGNGEPLFANFKYEDWMLLAARFELHLLLHAFKKDLNDADRPSFVEAHLAFYYQKYFKKPFTLKTFGVDSVAGLARLTSDTFRVDEKSGFVEASLADDKTIAHFCQLTENHRRERARRFDAGDESAQLKFPRSSPAAPKQPQAPPGRPTTATPAAWAPGQKRPLVPAPPSQPPQQRQRVAYGGGGGAGAPQQGGAYRR
mmetsp:Transcript_49219/g.138973  ORF Transcript_49219/g.138973 Transcript_49219/m.138973 type:complete len:854 (-) Transcript_49219:210-2771(-)